MKNQETAGPTDLSRLGYTNIPTLADIQPTPREQALLDSIQTWLKNSERSGIVIENPGPDSDIDQP